MMGKVTLSFWSEVPGLTRVAKCQNKNSSQNVGCISIYFVHEEFSSHFKPYILLGQICFVWNTSHSSAITIQEIMVVNIHR